MYLRHFQLREKPFEITTDSRFLWLGEKHQEAFATLRYGILENKGFLLLTGDVGTGKTTLINALINSLDDEVIVARIADPDLSLGDFFKTIASVFHLPQQPENKGEFLELFREFLEQAYEEGDQVLLIIDEAQRFRHELLEEIRLLSNIEKEHAKLLNIFFVGQNEFHDTILKPENRAIRQRITVNYCLNRLSEDETASYISHRLKIAGADRDIFTAEAVREIHLFSGGAPRLINIICDRALLTGFVDEKESIDDDIIRECATELEIHPYTPEDNDTGEETSRLQNGGLPRENVTEGPGTADEIPARRRKKSSGLGLFCIFFLLAVVLAGAIFFFFFSPEDFTLDLPFIRQLPISTPAGGQ
ncbi:ExeA family protein [Desulfolithobacter sp.]